MKWLFWKTNESRGPWPTPEVDYEGNMMWANAFPKPDKRQLIMNNFLRLTQNTGIMCCPGPAYYPGYFQYQGGSLSFLDGLL
jgi:hypothetical protein